MDDIAIMEMVEDQGVKVHIVNLDDDLSGLYYNKNIAINKNLDTSVERRCVLAEEAGHHAMNCGNILDQNDVNKAKQEKLGRNWGIELLIELGDIVEAYKNGVRNSYELANYLNITEEYLYEAVEFFQSKNESFVMIDDCIVEFNPLRVSRKVHIKL